MKTCILRKSSVSGLALALAVTLGLTSASTEAALMVDMNDAHVAGGDWETVAAPDHDNPIVLSDGTTLLFVASSGGATWATSSMDQATGGTPYADTIYEDVARDYFWSTATTKYIVLGNLNSSVSYSLNLISARASSGARVATITANGLAADATPHNGVNFNSYYDGWVDGVVLTWSNLTPDSNGEITLAFDPNTTDSYFINGFVLVPEPASMVLFGTGVLLLTARRRRA
ncbi:PEP-CTERM sorting domain-containing protein [Phycisphaerales bacterium AB-hyl4]|uniref:PEP-CTERM sorting domain-containing protein n=1 Tax=Natronomicrosphaera hydrolytica TaxID=3242702 RepID=A0ABV4U8Q3_9BACT